MFSHISDTPYSKPLNRLPHHAAQFILIQSGCRNIFLCSTIGSKLLDLFWGMGTLWHKKAEFSKLKSTTLQKETRWLPDLIKKNCSALRGSRYHLLECSYEQCRSRSYRLPELWGSTFNDSFSGWSNEGAPNHRLPSNRSQIMHEKATAQVFLRVSSFVYTDPYLAFHERVICWQSVAKAITRI